MMIRVDLRDAHGRVCGDTLLMRPEELQTGLNLERFNWPLQLMDAIDHIKGVYPDGRVRRLWLRKPWRIQ